MVVGGTVVLSTVVLKYDGARKYWCSYRPSVDVS